MTDKSGGGLYIYNYRNELAQPNTTTISNCIVKNNASSPINPSAQGGGIFINTSTILIIENNKIFNNIAVSSNAGGYGGGALISTSKILKILNNHIYSNQAGYTGGGILYDGLSYDNIEIRGNTIRDNQAVNGGGLYGTFLGPTTIEQNVITNNSATADPTDIDWFMPSGGGVNLRAYEELLTINNNLLSNNSAGYSGGGLFLESSDFHKKLNLTNNTIADNQAGSHGGGINILFEGDITQANIYNNIIWSNQAGNQGRDVYIDNDYNRNYLSCAINLYYNDFNKSSWGTYVKIPFSFHASNINIDPIFSNPEASNYRLGNGSPCINAGINTAPGIPSSDLDGKARIQGLNIDMGAYEGSYNVTATEKAVNITGVLILLLNNN